VAAVSVPAEGTDIDQFQSFGAMGKEGHLLPAGIAT